MVQGTKTIYTCIVDNTPIGLYITLQNPNDIAYVFSGYAPLSCRLAQFLHRPGWRSIIEVLNLLPGPTFDEVQQIPVGLRKRRMYGFLKFLNVCTFI